MTAESIVSVLLDGMDPGEFVQGYVHAWLNRLRTPGTFSVTSSHGELVADQDGNVVERRRYDAGDGDDDGEGQFIDDIAKFDVDEWRRYWREDPVKCGGMDILDMAWWNKDGTYSEAEEDWRADFKANREAEN